MLDTDGEQAGHRDEHARDEHEDTVDRDRRDREARIDAFVGRERHALGVVEDVAREILADLRAPADREARAPGEVGTDRANQRAPGERVNDLDQHDRGNRCHERENGGRSPLDRGEVGDIGREPRQKESNAGDRDHDPQSANDRPAAHLHTSSNASA
jgi:hypothetical protein